MPYTAAVGRVSADSLAAYPPGVPNVLPGETLSAEVVAFLRATAAAPSGYVRGAADPSLDQFRVVASTPAQQRSATSAR
ncbi:Orn/Lys/Arg family decarboxylase [Leucobacter soli]|uniref:Orn/Lys/Arg family decarboxylase n=1 Tax=Leucobacter soli TaxID=2812850 RepID=UPI003612A581